jgi:hypothetical protein
VLVKDCLNRGGRDVSGELHFAKLASLRECTSFRVQTLVLVVICRTP